MDSIIRKNQKGFTLIEVLTALLILTLLAISIPAILGPVATWICKARIETTAINYGASLLDELRSKPEKVNSLNAGKTAEEIGLVCESPVPGMTGQISYVQPRPSLPNLYEIILTITYSQAGQPGNLQLVTLIRKDPR